MATQWGKNVLHGHAVGKNGLHGHTWGQNALHGLARPRAQAQSLGPMYQGPGQVEPDPAPGTIEQGLRARDHWTGAWVGQLGKAQWTRASGP